MRALSVAAPIALLLPLAACNQDKSGAAIRIAATDQDGNVAGKIDGNTSEVAVSTPFFNGNMKLPGMTLTAENFEMNGVHLYPGTTISTMDVKANSSAHGDDDAEVRVTFDSPADPAVVRDWLDQRLTKAGYSLAANSTGLSGKTDEGKPFELVLTAAGAGHSKGVIMMR